VRREAVAVLRYSGYQVESSPTPGSQSDVAADPSVSAVHRVHLLLAIGSDYLIESVPIAAEENHQVSPKNQAGAATLPRALVISVVR
jgi:hypothetical protein